MVLHKQSTKMLINTIILFLAVLATAVPMPQDVSNPVAASSYWMSQIKRQGTVAYGEANYKIYRNVKEYGAVGDGNADDTNAINRAITDGDRCGEGCDSSTVKPAIIYFPPGTYKVSAPIIMYYYSQLIGDVGTPPTIVAAPSFQGLAMLDADPYIPGGNGAQWYTNQNNFYRQVRNFVIDLRPLPETQASSGIHWQVAQATSLQNIVFQMKPKSKSNGQVGMFIENGSGGFMSDLTFNGGNIGMNIGSQQFTTRNVKFNGCNTAINMLWDWLWTFKSLTITDCNIGINIAALNDEQKQTVGSAVIMDSTFKNTPIGISTAFDAQSQPVTGGTLIVHNVDFTGSANAIADSKGGQILAGGSKVASWAQGNVYLPQSGAAVVKRIPQAPADSSYEVEVVTETATIDATSTTPLTASGTPVSPATGTPSVEPPSFWTDATIGTSSLSATRPPVSTTAPYGNATTTGGNSTFVPAAACTGSAVPVTFSSKIQRALNAPDIPAVLLDASGGVFQKSRPQYEDLPVGSFISVKSAGAKGDGITDDSDAIQQIFNQAKSDQVVYFDHGAYVISKTIQVPKNIRITGEIWPLIMITGDFFSDAQSPKVAFRVGNPGDVGSVEITDLIFETLGPAPGAIMMEWNVAGTSQGSVGMWDVHFRVGGTAGTKLTDGNCKAGSSKVFTPECAGSFLMMHVTQQASAYFENTWFWLADHDLDTATHNQTTIYNGRGILVESKGPTWLWGTASEHNVFYNYQFANAQNVFMGAIQTETAYFQAAPDALSGGFTPNPAYHDPDFADCTGKSCKKTWGLRTIASRDIYMFGGGLYSFFEDYNQDCLKTESCQDNMIDLQCSNNIFLYGMVTKASTNQVNVNGKPVAFQKDNNNLFGSTIALFEQQ